MGQVSAHKKSGMYFRIPNILLIRLTLACLYVISFFFLQIFTDFEEIRQEIENETARISGNNKVRHGWKMEGFTSILLNEELNMFGHRHCC